MKLVPLQKKNDDKVVWRVNENETKMIIKPRARTSERAAVVDFGRQMFYII